MRHRSPSSQVSVCIGDADIAQEKSHLLALCAVRQLMTYCSCLVPRGAQLVEHSRKIQEAVSPGGAVPSAREETGRHQDRYG